jgi:hypothetical protein
VSVVERAGIMSVCESMFIPGGRVYLGLGFGGGGKVKGAVLCCGRLPGCMGRGGVGGFDGNGAGSGPGVTWMRVAGTDVPGRSACH